MKIHKLAQPDAVSDIHYANSMGSEYAANNQPDVDYCQALCTIHDDVVDLSRKWGI
jgi:hypothetical protein